jgi:DNA-binding CsgD family transcriptional regulator
MLEPAELLRFVHLLHSASTLEQLERRFLTGFGRIVGMPLYGFDLLDARTGRPLHVANANVSDAFAATYEREGRTADPVLAAAVDSGRPAYNLELMPIEEWEGSAIYRRVFRTYGVRHLLRAPFGEPVAGTVWAADPEREPGAGTIALVDATAAVLGDAVARLRLRRERDDALASLDLTATAIVVSDPREPRFRLNAAARRLLEEVVDADASLHRLLARPADDRDYARRVKVRLADGQPGELRVYAKRMPREHGGIVALLELQRPQAAISPGRLTPLTPREADVARLVVEGLADREIAARLFLSHHTVSQYLKRIYRKLEVDSRVALTGLLLSAS